MRRARRQDRPAGGRGALRPEPPGAAWRPVAAVFVLALVVRLVHVWQLRSAPFFSHLLGDAHGYDAWAQRLAAGDWIGRDVFYQAPLYPYLLGCFYSVFGRDLFAVRVGQAFLGALSCALIALAGTRLFGRRAGLASGLFLAFFAPALFFDGLIQKTALDGVLTAGLLLAIARLREQVTPGRCAVAGALVGLLALSRENALVLLPVLLVWLWLRTSHRLGPVAATVLAAALVLLPVAARNLAVGGDGWYLTTSQFGPNFYIGNHEHATGTYVPLRSGRGSVEFERADATEIAQEAAGRPLGPSEVSQYWSGRAFDWITANPGAWLRLTGRKLLLLVNRTEAADTEDLASHALWSVPLRVTAWLLTFGVLGPLALLGMWVSRARWRDLWLFHALAGAYALSVVSFFVLDRYRYPLVPFLVLFAGAGLVEFGDHWRRSAPRERWATLALVVVAAVTCYWPLLSIADMRAITHYNVGAVLQEEGRSDEAVSEYRAALALQPALASAHSNLGALLATKGEQAAALEHCREAVRLNPELATAHVNLGVALAGVGRPQDAITAFRRALELLPENAEAHYNLARAFAELGDARGAADHLRETVRLAPNNAAAHNNLGILLCSTGRIGEGIEQLETAVRLGFEGAAANLEHARRLARQGRQGGE